MVSKKQTKSSSITSHSYQLVFSAVLGVLDRESLYNSTSRRSELNEQEIHFFYNGFTVKALL